MNTYRILGKRGAFHPQERFFFVFWKDIVFHSPSLRGGFKTYKEAQIALSDHIMKVDSNV